MSDGERVTLNIEQARRLYLLTAVHRMWPSLTVWDAVVVARWLMTGTAPEPES